MDVPAGIGTVMYFGEALTGDDSVKINVYLRCNLRIEQSGQSGLVRNGPDKTLY